MKRIIITLISAIAVFVATIVVTNLHIYRGAESAAEYLNNQSLDNFCDALESDILLTQRSVYNFLGFIFYDPAPEDSIPMTIDSKYTEYFKRYVYDYLEGFMRMNQYYQSAMFVVDSTICRKYFGKDHVFAPMINQGDTVHHDVSKHHDFTKSANYKRLKEIRRTFWSEPTAGSDVEGMVINMYVPLTIDNDQFFGAFIVSIDVKILDDILRNNLPYGEEHSQIMLLDERGDVFASYPSVLKREGDGKKYYTYERKTDYAAWTIRTVCEEEAVYKETGKFVWVIFFTSTIGMLLMFITCFVIFRQINRNMRQKAQAEEELKVAANLQMSILKPTTFRTGDIRIESFIRPAIQAGGDLYDYVQIGDKTLVIIGDVSGKGMPAALFMTQVVSLFRNVVRYTQSPEKIMDEINDSLAENNPTMTFCTAIIVCLNADNDGSMTLCNAGHTRPIIRHQATGGCHFAELHPNIPLGVMPGYKYQIDRPEYGNGDTIVMYTDGVTEAKNRTDELYEEKRLIEVAEKDCSVTGILSSVEAFAKHAAQSDDITIMTINS